jgi:hypothetical protein
MGAQVAFMTHAVIQAGTSQQEAVAHHVVVFVRKQFQYQNSQIQYIAEGKFTTMASRRQLGNNFPAKRS